MAWRGVLISVILELSAYHLPAPIIETPDQPAAQQQAKPKTKYRPKTPQTTTTRSSKLSTPSTLQGPARFAGTWGGAVKQGWMGRVSVTYTISADATSVQASQNMGGGTHPATVTGDTISWPGTLSATASLTLNSDGQTAQFVLKGMLGSTTATFHRMSAASTTSTPVSTQPTPAPLAPSSVDTRGYDTVALRPSGSMSGPKPEIPPEAHDQHLSGTGVFLLHFDKPTGNLLDVTVSQSTGSPVLDQAAIATLRQWHATPGCPREVPMTVTFATLGP
jgi:TonB family protein